jgi:hypothetical protein
LGQRQALAQAQVVLSSLLQAGLQFSFSDEELHSIRTQIPYVISLTIRNRPFNVIVSKV